MADQEIVAAGVIAALDAAGARPYDLDDATDAGAAGTLPDAYTQVTVTRMFGGVLRVGGGVPGSLPYRVTTRAVAKTVTGARQIRAKAASLEGQPITVDSSTAGVWVFESEDPIGPDDGMYSGLTTWTLTL